MKMTKRVTVFLLTRDCLVSSWFYPHSGRHLGLLAGRPQPPAGADENSADHQVDAETDLVGIASAESGAEGIAAECVFVVVADSVSQACVIPEESAVLLKTGRGRLRCMRWCAVAVNILCNNVRAALTAGQYVANAQQTRSKTTFYRVEHALLADFVSPFRTASELYILIWNGY